MDIAIDCRSLKERPSGVANYLIAAINAIATNYPEWNLYLLSNAALHTEASDHIVKRKNIKVVIEPFIKIKYTGFLWYIFKVYFMIKKLKPDIFWAPAFFLPPVVPKNVKTIVTVHDVVFKQYKHTMSWPNRILSEIFYDTSIKKSDLIWTNSHYTKKEISKYFPEMHISKIFVGCSVNEKVFRKLAITSDTAENYRKEFNIKGKLLLFVGTLEPRKNLKFLISLMPLLAEKNFTLLIVGAKGWGNNKFLNDFENTENFPHENIIFSGFISSDQLVHLYNIADVFVSTSLNEGFGLPQLEAMACGCPVVSPHNSAMIEVVEGAGETVVGWNEKDWVKTIENVSKNREKYIELGFRRCREYSWNNIVLKLKDYIK